VWPRLEGPHERGQVAVGVVPQREGGPGVGDRRGDLRAVADDPGVSHEALDVAVVERGDGLRVEAGERLAEGRSLAQDRRPGQPRLEGLEGQPLEHPAFVAHRHPPLGVVVLRSNGSTDAHAGRASPSSPMTTPGSLTAGCRSRPAAGQARHPLTTASG
jgi:hypothetical protein